MLFQGSGAGQLLQWTPFSAHRPLAYNAASNRIRPQFRAILKLLEHGYSDANLLELSRTLIEVLTLTCPQHGGGRPGGDQQRIETAMNDMRATLNHPRSLHGYARRANLSDSQFSHLFQKHVGTSPMNYLNELRMQRASELLTNTDWPIKRIAHQLGYEDALYFSKAFRKNTGHSPSQHRKLVHG
jgi:transcriptional regulator GlxA family with amidase domain